MKYMASGNLKWRCCHPWQEVLSPRTACPSFPSCEELCTSPAAATCSGCETSQCKEKVACYSARLRHFVPSLVLHRFLCSFFSIIQCVSDTLYPLSAVAFPDLCPLRCFLSNHQVVALSTIFGFINEAMNVLILWYAALFRVLYHLVQFIINQLTSENPRWPKTTSNAFGDTVNSVVPWMMGFHILHMFKRCKDFQEPFDPYH